MECERCKDIIESGEEREYAGRVLCEDCYMDALSPAKTCDPWAVHSAKIICPGRPGPHRCSTLFKNKFWNTCRRPAVLNPGRFPNGFRSNRPTWNGKSPPCGTWKRSGGNCAKGESNPVVVRGNPIA